MAGLISTKGRYALRVMAYLASHEGWVSLGDISEEEDISRKYLEQVVALLAKAGFVRSQRGKKGGYMLTKPANQYSLASILRAVEGPLAPVACLDCTVGEICPRVERCSTVELWRELGEVTNSFLNSKHLSDLVVEKQ